MDGKVGLRFVVCAWGGPVVRPDPRSDLHRLLPNTERNVPMSPKWLLFCISKPSFGGHGGTEKWWMGRLVIDDFG